MLNEKVPLWRVLCKEINNSIYMMKNDKVQS